MDIKPGYKLTEVGAIPDDWLTVSFGNLYLEPSRNGVSHSREDRGTGYKMVNMGELFAYPRILDIEMERTTLSPNEIRNSILEPGDLLFARRSLVLSGAGKCSIYSGSRNSTTFESSIIRVRLNPDLAVPEFFFHLFSSYFGRSAIERIAGQGAVAGIKGSDLFGIVVPLPPAIIEQRAIADALSDMDDQITALDDLIAKKRNLKQGAMQELLTGEKRLPGFSGEWKTRSFDELFDFLNTANSPRSDLSAYGDIEYIHYGDIHVKWTAFLDCAREALPKIAFSKVQSIPHLEDGDLIMADASEDYEGIGASIEIKNIGNRKIVSGLHTLLLRGDRSLLANGFKGYLQYIPSVKDALIKTATGISVYGISKHNIKNIDVLLPEPKEQQSIATILSEMDAEIATLEDQREKTVALKQGMMQELLTGKTRLI